MHRWLGVATFLWVHSSEMFLVSNYCQLHLHWSATPFFWWRQILSFISFILYVHGCCSVSFQVSQSTLSAVFTLRRWSRLESRPSMAWTALPVDRRSQFFQLLGCHTMRWDSQTLVYSPVRMSRMSPRNKNLCKLVTGTVQLRCLSNLNIFV